MKEPEVNVRAPSISFTYRKPDPPSISPARHFECEKCGERLLTIHAVGGCPSCGGELFEVGTPFPHMKVESMEYRYKNGDVEFSCNK